MIFDLLRPTLKKICNV